MLKELQQQIADGLRATTANGRKELQEKKLSTANNPIERELMQRMRLVEQAVVNYCGNAPSADAMAIVAAILTRGNS
jgi:hypothetical protein